MAKEALPELQSLNILDIQIERNAYGRQTESFEVELQVKEVGNVQGIFIRAPQIQKVGPSVEILATHENHPVLVQEGNYLASTFHPELTENLWLHRYFLSLIQNKSASPNRRRESALKL